MRIGILSTAHVHAEAYAAILATLPGVEPLIADSDDPLRGRTLADRLNLAFIEDYDEVLSAADGVIVTSENVRHRALVERAAAAGVAVLCEKPLATTLEDALAMQEACRRAGTGLMVAYPVGFSPEAEHMRELVNAGHLGTVVGAIGVNTGKLPLERDWFADAAQSGGGALVDHVVHLADLLDATLGARATHVYAAINSILYADRAAEGVETGGLITVRYDNGLAASIDCSWSQPQDAPTWGGLTLELIGTGGNASIDPFAHAVAGFAGGSSLSLPFGVDANRRMLAAFVAAVRGERPFAPDSGVGVRTLAIMLAAQEAARTGETVDVRP